MNQEKRPSRAGLRVVIGILAGLAAAALAPILMLTSSVVYVYPILSVIIYAMSGLIPAMVSIAANILVFDLYFGVPGTIIAIGAFTLPTVVMMRGLKWRRSFPEQIRMAIAAHFLGIAACLVGIRLHMGRDIIDVFVELMRGYMEQVQPGVLDVVMMRIFNSEMLPEGIEAAQLTEGLLSAAQRADYLDAFTDQLKNSMALSLPGMLLSSAAVTAVTGVHVSNLILRKYPGRMMCYMPITRWFTPWQISLGLASLLLISLLLNSMGMGGADTIYMTILSLLRTSFMMQAVISVNRHMASIGKRTWVRCLLIAILIIFAPAAAVIYGSISAIFGVHGALRQLRLRRSRKKGNDDI